MTGRHVAAAPTAAAAPVSDKPYSPNPSLKRARSDSLSMELPALPRIGSETILEVFTHRTLRFSGAQDDSEYGNSDRLAAIGRTVLETAITMVLFNKRPMITGDEIKNQRKMHLSDESIARWVGQYKLRDKVRCMPTAADTLTSPEETRFLFDSYVGAVFVTHKLEGVLNWVGALVDPSYQPSAQQGLDPEPGNKRYRPEFPPPQPLAPPPPPPPTSAPPPMPATPHPASFMQHSSMQFSHAPSPPLSNPLNPAQPASAFLPLFNQTANQRRLTVEYPAQFTGPAHAGRWQVKCIVDGIEKGVGMGPSKQLAKEEAAREAFYKMGWAPRM